MATITHLSHLELTEIGRTSTSIIFEGTLAACRRMAFAHGMEVEKVEGAILAVNDNGGFYAPVVESAPACTWFKGGGLIIKGQDAYCLVMPLGVWTNN